MRRRKHKGDGERGQKDVAITGVPRHQGLHTSTGEKKVPAGRQWLWTGTQ